MKKIVLIYIRKSIGIDRRETKIGKLLLTYGLSKRDQVKGKYRLMEYKVILTAVSGYGERLIQVEALVLMRLRLALEICITKCKMLL